MKLRRIIRCLASASLLVFLACGDSGSTSESDGANEFPGGPCEDAGTCAEGEVCYRVSMSEGCTSNTSGGGGCPDSYQCKAVPNNCYNTSSDEELESCLSVQCDGCAPYSYSGNVFSCQVNSGCF